MREQGTDPTLRALSWLNRHPRLAALAAATGMLAVAACGPSAPNTNAAQVLARPPAATSSAPKTPDIPTPSATESRAAANRYNKQVNAKIAARLQQYLDTWPERILAQDTTPGPAQDALKGYKVKLYETTGQKKNKNAPGQHLLWRNLNQLYNGHDKNLSLQPLSDKPPVRGDTTPRYSIALKYTYQDGHRIFESLNAQEYNYASSDDISLNLNGFQMLKQLTVSANSSQDGGGFSIGYVNTKAGQDHAVGDSLEFNSNTGQTGEKTDINVAQVDALADFFSKVYPS